jgi:hypothetical protein
LNKEEFLQQTIGRCGATEREETVGSDDRETPNREMIARVKFDFMSEGGLS